MMLEIKDLHFKYSARRPEVLSGAELSLGAGEIGILLGPNGSGKTTLFQTLLGVLKPLSGQILFEGQDLEHLSRRERARLMAYVPQHIHFGNLTVFDSVLTGRLSWFGFRAGQEDEAAVRRILEELGLSELSARDADTLSGGEQQRVAIARALVQEPKLLIFDEPTGNLDIAGEQLIAREAKKAARERGIGILAALHDLNQALELGDRFFLMKDGKILRAGGPEILTEEIIEEVYRAKVRVVEIEGKKYIINGGNE